MNLTFQAPVSSGMWTVTDDLGNKYPFKVRWDAAVGCCCQRWAQASVQARCLGPLTVSTVQTLLLVCWAVSGVCWVLFMYMWLAGQYGDQGQQA